MCVYEYTYVYMCVCRCIYIYIYIYVCVCVCVYVYLCVCVCVYVYMFIAYYAVFKQGGIKYHFLSLWYDSTWDWTLVIHTNSLCTYVCVCMSIHMYICVYVDVYIYIYIYVCVCVYLCVCMCICLYDNNKWIYIRFIYSMPWNLICGPSVSWSFFTKQQSSGS